MRIIKIIGLFIFLTGFILFNASFFFSSYRLTPEMVQQKITDKKKEQLFLKEAKDLLGKDVPSNFAFVAGLNEILSTINDHQIKLYSVTDEDMDKLVSLNNGKFSLSTVDSAFNTSNEIGAFKRKAIKDYTNWMDGQTFNSPDELRSQLSSIKDKINSYGILSDHGFDRYQIKDLKYALTKSAATGPVKDNPLLYLLLTVGLCVLGAMAYILPKLGLQPGIKNNRIFFNVMKNTGWLGILTGSWLIIFYLLLYFYPEYMTNWIIMVDPVSLLLNGHEASRFFLYGFIYTLCIIVMGVRMIIHYRHSKYQILRTCSVMFFQTAFAFLIPEILVRLNKPYFDFKNIWPLDYGFFFDFRLNQLIESGTLGIFMLGWGIALIIIAVPVLVYFFGKRWYCSWVCGCGGLAETLGDPYRQLSSKSLKSWKIERWMVHGVLAFAIIMTVGVLYTYFTKSSWFLFFDSYTVREIYGVLIGAGFAGVVGTGFYPLMGNRVWCRFGCPLAAYLGI
ncbi:MAG: 4Fe-4S ferredoxin, partial [Marivirga sp.]|nr:4Fe-4S ferredoxin [Marivirga sp.]